MTKRIAVIVALLFFGLCAGGQEFGISTNMIDYVNMGTLNIEASYAMSRHWSLSAGVKYNPFSYRTDTGTVRNCQRSVSAGARFWPWHTYSGWWLSGALRYQEYNIAGIGTTGSSQGDRLGASVSGGYSYMLSPRLNVEFGAGIWGGYDSYSEYACSDCGRKVAQGQKFFILPCGLLLALTYIF